MARDLLREARQTLSRKHIEDDSDVASNTTVEDTGWDENGVQREYEVNKILAEQNFIEEDSDGIEFTQTKYLVSWTGWSVHDSTWEPVTSIVDGLES